MPLPQSIPLYFVLLEAALLVESGNWLGFWRDNGGKGGDQSLLGNLFRNV